VTNGLGAHLTILGGGPAGLSVAHYAHERSVPFTLFEKAARFGGLCRTEQCGTHRFDTGAHRFHDQDSEITGDLKRLIGSELKSVSKPSKVWLSGRFADFPPTPANLLFSGGVLNASRIGWDLLRNRFFDNRKEPVSFADFAIHSFGRTLAELFLLNYSAKVWGLPADQLSPAVATRRLSGMTLKTLVAELFQPRRRTAHLDGQFLYPLGGYGRIADSIVAGLPSDRLWENHELSGIDLSGDRISRLRFSDGSSREVADRVVWTLPLTLAVRLLGSDVFSAKVIGQARELRFRQIRLIYLRLNRPRFSDNASIYIPDPKYCLSRIYEPKNRCETMAPPDETGLAVEVPCFPGDELDGLSDMELRNRVSSELSDIGILGPSEILDWRHILLPNAYPVYSIGFEARVEAIIDEASQVKNLVLLGRNGTFFYSHLHNQMRFARDLIESILADPAHVTAGNGYRNEDRSSGTSDKVLSAP
jgi:protoporphyrinogen oxidase